MRSVGSRQGGSVACACQRGWVGLVVILLALVIVALLAQTALKQYGLLDDPRRRSARSRASRGRPGAPSTPRNALERARGVEDMVEAGRRRAACRSTTMRSSVAMSSAIRIRSSPARAGRSSPSRSSSPSRCRSRLVAARDVAWLVVVFILQFFRDPPRDVPASRMRCCRRPTAASCGRQGARSVPRARRAQDQRVHERVQRAFEPQPGRRRGRRARGITPAASSTPRSTRRRSTTSATRCSSRTADGRRRHLRADRRADRAPHPVLREARRRARARPALRLHPLRLARRRLPAARRRARASASATRCTRPRRSLAELR